MDKHSATPIESLKHYVQDIYKSPVSLCCSARHDVTALQLKYQLIGFGFIGPNPYSSFPLFLVGKVPSVGGITQKLLGSETRNVEIPRKNRFFQQLHETRITLLL